MTKVYTKVYTFVMTTKFIGIKEFRQNISAYVKKAQKRENRFVVMNRNSPLFEIKPFDEDFEIEDILQDLIQGTKDMKEGRVYTHKEMLSKYSK